MSFLSEMSRFTWELVLGFAFLSAYLLLVLWARSKYIAQTNRVWTEAHVDATRANVAVLHAAFPSAPSRAMQGVITSLLPAGTHGPAPRRANLHWNGAQEIGDWVRLHEIKRGLVFLMPDELVVPRFERVMGQLDELPAHRQEHWKAKADALRCAEPATSVAAYRALLVELLSEVYNARDGKYAQLASLYSKAAWLIGAALLPLAVLVALGYGVILIAGAVGGIVSRLQRLVYAEGLPTAYGSSWVPLFCAPLLGALAAWAGLNLLALLQALGVVDLRSLLSEPRSLLVPPPGVIGMAVLLGISERVLNRIGTETEKAMGPSDATAAPATGPVPAAAATRESDDLAALVAAALLKAQPPEAATANGNGAAKGRRAPA